MLMAPNNLPQHLIKKKKKKFCDSLTMVVQERIIK